jgi:hypothetical protein
MIQKMYTNDCVNKARMSPLHIKVNIAQKLYNYIIPNIAFDLCIVATNV